MSPTEFKIGCSHILLDADRYISPGYVTCRNGVIVEVAEHCNGRPDIDLGDGLLMPALVNAHTHLEFSDLTAPFPAGSSFPDWIGSVLAHRRLRDGESPTDRLHAAYRKGLAECLANGTGVLADIVTPPWQGSALDVALSPGPEGLSPDCRSTRDSLSTETRTAIRRHLSPLETSPKSIACHEQLGLNYERYHAAQQWLDSQLNTNPDEARSRLLGRALSPHAPYSVHPELFAATVDSARVHRLPLVMHLAESPAEREWLDHNRGPFRDLLERFQHGHPMQPPKLTEVIAQLATAPRSLIIHGNYLNQDEITAVAAAGSSMTVVFCPRTHHHFSHQPYPFEALRSAGIRVVLGTDSRSTNPDLSIWQEAQFACDSLATLSPSRAFRAITADAADALGVASDYGTIAEGRIASFAFIPLSADRTTNVRSTDILLEKAWSGKGSPWHVSLLSEFTT